MISYYVHFAYGDAPRRLFLFLNFFCYILSVIRLSSILPFGFFYGYIFHFEFGEVLYYLKIEIVIKSLGE